MQQVVTSTPPTKLQFDELTKLTKDRQTTGIQKFEYVPVAGQRRQELYRILLYPQ